MLKAGVEIDTLIAERVMGWMYKDFKTPYVVMGQPETMSTDYVPPFSTDITAAWMIVDRLHEMGWSVFVACYCDNEHVSSPFEARCWKRNDPQFPETISIGADTAPLAICTAALKAVGYEVKAC